MRDYTHQHDSHVPVDHEMKSAAGIMSRGRDHRRGSRAQTARAEHPRFRFMMEKFFKTEAMDDLYKRSMRENYRRW